MLKSVKINKINEAQLYNLFLKVALQLLTDVMAKKMISNENYHSFLFRFSTQLDFMSSCLDSIVVQFNNLEAAKNNKFEQICCSKCKKEINKDGE